MYAPRQVPTIPGYPGTIYSTGKVSEHYLVWWLNTGELPPKGCFIYHKNGLLGDNRFENLYLKRRGASERRPFNLKWPDDSELKCQVWALGGAVVARNLGVSPQAVSRRCQEHGILTPPRAEACQHRVWAKLPPREVVSQLLLKHRSLHRVARTLKTSTEHIRGYCLSVGIPLPPPYAWREKLDWPPDEELRKRVWAKPLQQVAKDMGIRQQSLWSRCKKHGIKVPGMGHWPRGKKSA